MSVEQVKVQDDLSDPGVRFSGIIYQYVKYCVFTGVKLIKKRRLMLNSSNKFA